MILNIKEFFKNINKKRLLITGVLIIFALIHTALLMRTFHIDKENTIHVAFDAYGDMPLHMTQISKFAYQPLTDMVDPIYYGHRLQYPFVINFISGIILRFTGALEFSVLIPVIFFAWLNIFLLFYIYRKTIGSWGLGCLGVILFYLGSGLSAFMQSDLWNKVAHGEFIATNVNSTLGYPFQSVDFATPLINFFLFQRSFIIGFSAFLLFIIALLFLRERKQTRFAILAGICLGLMPLLHMHTFIAASGVMCIFFLLEYKKLFKKMVLLGGISLILAIPQILYLVNFNNVGQGFIHFRLGWMTETSVRSIAFGPAGNEHILQSFINFFFLNFGIMVPTLAFVLIAIIVLFIKQKRKTDIHTALLPFTPIIFPVLCALLLFIIVELFRFQPWDFDDNKILLYFQFFEVIVLLWFYKFISRKNILLSRSLLIIFLAISLFSGILDVISHLHSTRDEMPVMYTKEARELASYVKEHTQPTDLIITGTDHLNPINGLLGRPAYVGYVGWLWTRGIPYTDRERELFTFYNNPTPNSPLFKDFNADYVLVDVTNPDYYPTNIAFFNSGFTLLYNNDRYYLFKRIIK